MDSADWCNGYIAYPLYGSVMRQRDIAYFAR